MFSGVVGFIKAHQLFQTLHSLAWAKKFTPALGKAGAMNQQQPPQDGAGGPPGGGRPAPRPEDAGREIEL